MTVKITCGFICFTLEFNNFRENDNLLLSVFTPGEHGECNSGVFVFMCLVSTVIYSCG